MTRHFEFDRYMDVLYFLIHRMTDILCLYNISVLSLVFYERRMVLKFEDKGCKIYIGIFC